MINIGRFIVVVVDSFGIGHMDDVPIVRPEDIGANTCLSVLNTFPQVNLQNFEDLGLGNALGKELKNLKFSQKANYGTIDLAHYGCDTFMGHQELMGTIPKKPLEEPFGNVKEKVKKALILGGHRVEEFEKILVVDNNIFIGDNLEADLGQVYNIAASFVESDFEKVIKVGKIVRESVKVARVIAFGGDSEVEAIKKAYKEKGQFAGIDTPKSGIYKSGFRVEHMGYGIDEKKQIPYFLDKNNIKTFLFGKVADIVKNPQGINYEKRVDTDEIFTLALEEINKNEKGYFCINIQETDLAGHSEDSKRYMDRLILVDKYLIKIIDRLNKEDILVVTADHGNDPNIGHSKHTREKVPLLFYKEGIEGIHFGHRKTLADIGASVLDYYSIDIGIGRGRSFLDKLKM